VLDLLSRHQRWLRTVVSSRLGESQAVEDVMQEVALAAVNSGASAGAPWLYRVAVRQALLFRRRQGRRRKLEERYARGVAPTSNTGAEYDPLGFVLSEERKLLIRRALARLRRKDVEILLLKYTENWSYRELSEHLGVPESTVEARLHRARKRLRGELAALQVIEVKP